MLTSSNDSQADTEIRGYFSKAVQAKGGRVTSSQNLLPRKGNSLQQHTLRATMMADLTQLSAILHALESHMPVLLVDDLQLRKRNNASRNAGATLQVNLSVTGFRATSVGAP